jgi:hypothetical protein
MQHLMEMDRSHPILVTMILVRIIPRTPSLFWKLIERIQCRTSGNASLLIVIGTLGCLANATVLYVLVRSRKLLGDTVSVFIVNQTFLDLLACFLMTIGTVVLLTGASNFSVPTCIIVGGGVSTMAAINASSMSLVLITLERYVKIVHPIRHRNHFRRWMTYAGVALCWINGLGTCVISDFVVGRNCLLIPISVGKVCTVGSFRPIAIR